MKCCKTEAAAIFNPADAKTISGPVSVGIDVAMETLMVCEQYDGGKKKVKEIKNSEASAKRLADKLIKQGYSGKIIMESTGRHHILSALILSENKLDVRVINPLLAKKYSQASIRKIKTDKRDSEILAEIGIKEENLPASFKMDKKAVILRKQMRLIYSLSKQLQNLKTLSNEHKKTLGGLKCELSPIEKQIFETIAVLKKQKEQLEKKLEDSILENEISRTRAERYDSIPGVSSYVAALASLIFSDEHSRSAKQWIAFVGMDVSVSQSAKWIGKGRLTKRGNDYLRMRFYSAAWGAVRHNEKFKDYYEHLKSKNRKHKEALIIIARKIIGIMFSLNKQNIMYNESMPLFTVSQKT